MTGMRQQAIRLLIGGAFLAGIAVALIWHFSAAPAVTAPRVAAPAPPVAAPVQGAGAAAGGAPTAARAVRDVTPQGMARVYLQPSEERAAPPVTSIQISHAGAMPDGSISGDGGTVRLYGVALPDGNRICVGASGESWPCGRRAYISLHNKVAAQTVRCEPRTSAQPAAADCFLGEVNLAAWIIGQGLARVSSNVGDKDLIAAEAAARGAKRGLWADPREAAMTAPGP